MGAAANLVTGPTEEHQRQPDDDDDDAYGPEDRDGEYGTEKEEDEPKNDHAGLFPLTTETKPVGLGRHIVDRRFQPRRPALGPLRYQHPTTARRYRLRRRTRTPRHPTNDVQDITNYPPHHRRVDASWRFPGAGFEPALPRGRGVEVLGTLELRSFEVLRGPSSLGHRPPQSAGTSHVRAGPVLNPCTDQTGGTGWTTGVAPSGVNAPRRR